MCLQSTTLDAGREDVSFCFCRVAFVNDNSFTLFCLCGVQIAVVTVSQSSESLGNITTANAMGEVPAQCDLLLF